MRVLLAVDGSRHSLQTVASLVRHAQWLREKPQVELVTVHLPVPRLPGMSAAVGKSQIERYYREEGEKALAEAKRQLERAGIAYEPHVLVGQVAETLVEHAKKRGCDLIYIGTHGRSPLGKALVGSTATKVLHLADIPVLLVK